MSWLADVTKGKAKAKETRPSTNSEVVWNRINPQKNLMVRVDINAHMLMSEGETNGLVFVHVSHG